MSSLSPLTCQVSDYSKQCRFAALCYLPLSSSTVVHPLQPSHGVPCSADSCSADGGGAQALLLQRYTGASGDGPWEWCLYYGPASTQTCSPWPGCARAALQEDKQTQNCTVYSGVTAVLHTEKITRNKTQQFCLLLATSFVLHVYQTMHRYSLWRIIPCFFVELYLK